MTRTIDVTDADFAREVLESDLPVVVDFWAEWCGPCHTIAPILDELAGEFDGRVKFARLDTASNFRVANQYGVRGLPTLLMFKGGERVDRITGARPRDELRRYVEKALD